MRNLRLPNYNPADQPIRKYPKLSNLRRATVYNQIHSNRWIEDSNYNLNNTHPLISALRLLAIDPNWSLEELLLTVRFKANVISSTCGITNSNRVGPTHTNVMYSGIRESLFLIYNNKSYNEKELNIDDLNSVIPIYTNKQVQLYIPEIVTSTSTSPGDDLKVAVIGVDLVELAIGWWLYMKQDRTNSRGIGSYLTKYPLAKACLFNNQLNMLNMLDNYVSLDIPFNLSFNSNKTPFFKVEEEREITSYLIHLHDVLSNRRIDSVSQLLNTFENLYDNVESPVNLIRDNRQLDNFNNSRWVLDFLTLKVYKIYLTYCNTRFHKAGDINVKISVLQDKLKNNYQRITDDVLRNELRYLLSDVVELNEINKK